MQHTNSLLQMLHSVNPDDWELAVEMIRNYKNEEMPDNVIQEVSDFFDERISNNDLRYSKTQYNIGTYHLMRTAIILDQRKKEKSTVG